MDSRSAGIVTARGAWCGVFRAVALALAVASRSMAQAPDTAAFESAVRPLLVEHCFRCHSGEKSSGGLSLDSRDGWARGGDSGPAIVPGDPAASPLLRAVRGDEGISSMPPEEDATGHPLRRLSPSEIAALEAWILSGAPDPRVAGEKIGGMSREEAASWWAFRPLAAPTVPALPDGPSVHGDIDRFVRSRLDAEGLAPAPPADRRTLIRRATYDLHGLPPTDDEVRAFLADPADDRSAFRLVVERLLASPAYGERWGRHWLDVVRYADTAGENTDRPLPHAWRYRNWVFGAFAADLPWRDFVRLQLAGDVLGAGGDDAARRAGVVATGYLAVARRFGHDIDKDVHLMHEDVIDNLGKNFLGLTTGCARCHDHKYDPVSADDYYALYGIFAGTRFPFPGCEAKGQPRDLVDLAAPGEIEAALAPWRAGVAAREEAVKARDEAGRRSRLTALFAAHARPLAGSAVAEGARVPIASADGAPLEVTLGRGDVVEVAVLPNANHGADTTVVDLALVCRESPRGELVGREWTTRALAAAGLPENPVVEAGDGAAWCFVAPAKGGEGPRFLATRRTAVEGKPELSAWTLGELPSAFVNASEAPVKAWTELPGRTFFVHPSADRGAAVAWVCPADGRYALSGSVADGHPAGLDGVSFTVTHVASAEYGPALLELGRIETAPLPDPGPPPTFPLAYAVAEGTPADVPIQERGDPLKPGRTVPRRWIGILGGQPVPGDGGSGRVALAEWVATSPLATRVIVNRIWQWHFGQGLVRTPNDFGSRGEPPTHPELLEWLARRFEAEGGSLKAFHRLILDSSVWQRSAAAPAEAFERDPENRLLARFSSRRLAAEEIRDSLLAAAGTLDPTPGEGHPFPPESTWTFTQHTPFNAVYDTPRRSAYLMVQRQRRHPFLALFDGADPNASTPVRQTTTMPTQALWFMNDPFFHAQAERVAARARHEAGTDDPAAVIARLHRILLQRDPRPDEVDRATALLAAYPGDAAERFAAVARVLLAANEFLHVD